MFFEIKLTDLIFYSYIGVTEEERVTGNEFKVNLCVILPFTAGIEHDRLESTISYADLFEIIAEEMKIRRQLLETVALNIVNRIKNEFPIIEKGSISIEKRHPPIPGMIGRAAVTLNF